MSELFFNVNGKDFLLRNFNPFQTLASYLRNQLGLNGVKLGCEEGVCGACTVVLGRLDHNGKPRYTSVNACLVRLYQLHLTFIITVEGVGDRVKTHPVQERLAKGHAAQCGFCTPGYVMSMYALLRNNPNPTRNLIDAAIRGNRCRCTGYRPILEALYSFCCGGQKDGKCCRATEPQEEKSSLLSFEDFPKYDPTQDIIFPPSIMLYEIPNEDLIFNNNSTTIILPTSLDSLIKQIKKGRKFISSGIGTDFGNICGDFVSGKLVPELNKITVTESKITVGAALSIQDFFTSIASCLKQEQKKMLETFAANFSSQQIANFATWSGSVMQNLNTVNRDVPSDVLTLLAAFEAHFHVVDRHGEQKIINFDQLLENNHELVVISVDVETNISDIFTFKQGKNGHCDTPELTFVSIKKDKEWRIKVSKGRLPVGIDNVKSENVPTFKESLLTAALMKFDDYASNGAKTDKNDDVQYLQYYKPREDIRSEFDPVGRPLANVNNDRAVSGEAVYISDMEKKASAHVGFVLSAQAHARIKKIDAGPALELPGVLGYFDVKDLPGSNQPGLAGYCALPDDTTIFADGEVYSIGQIVGLIAAKDVKTARKAAKLVNVEYEPLQAITNIEEARETNSYLGEKQHFGVTEQSFMDALQTCDLKIEGRVETGAQEHFYMEPQGSFAEPLEADEILIHCGTQGFSYTQLFVAEALGLAGHKVIVKTRRMGGAFGGKISTASVIAVCAALVAKKLNLPTSAVLSRMDDLIMTGKRHPTLSEYTVGVSKEGIIGAVGVKAFLNGGWSKDQTEGVSTVYALNIEDTYNFKNVFCEVHPLKTNTISNTAMRGYGFPQAKMTAEGIIRKISHELGIDEVTLKEMNMKTEGVKYTGSPIRNDALKLCWEACKELSDFDRRKEKVEQHNRASKTIKRGISISAVRFSLPHPGASSNGIASVAINLDGSVQLSIGGTEMGQGLNTKCIQVCSRELNIPMERITIIDGCTSKIVNGFETGGSQNTDTNGMAVINCCRRLMSGLGPHLESENDNWEKAVLKAYHAFVPLQCTEYGRDRREDYGIGSMEAPYSTTGACAVEIELDCVTGIHQLLQVDMIMDIGESLNPALDIGQIEGAFFQAYGMVTCEEVTYDSDGALVQDSSSKYKLPTAAMVPKKFRVKLLRANQNFENQVHSSKGVGEPPYIMSCGAIHSALMSAIGDYRKETNLNDFVETRTPLTTEHILNFLRT